MSSGSNLSKIVVVGLSAMLLGATCNQALCDEARNHVTDCGALSHLEEQGGYQKLNECGTSAIRESLAECLIDRTCAELNSPNIRELCP